MAMPVALIVACAALGAAVGAVTPRIAYRLSVPYGAPSHSACDRCARPFAAGIAGWVRPECACPGCGSGLGPRMWVCVLAGAVSFGLLAWALGPVAALPAYLTVAGFGVLLAFIDLACLRLPDRLVAAALVLGGGLLVVVSATDGSWDFVVRAALGALVSAVVYLLLALLPGANLGLGDVKLAATLGFLLGWLGWPAVVLGLMVPHLLNGPVALGLLLTRRAGRKSDLPLGPAMLAGALLAVVLATRALP
jgi:leader peptidase (prepilin peptidase) / N-methyltransferase